MIRLLFHAPSNVPLANPADQPSRCYPQIPLWEIQAVQIQSRARPRLATGPWTIDLVSICIARRYTVLVDYQDYH
jgi:hypothetical protein